MIFKLQYGKEEVPLEIPDSVDADVIEPRPLPTLTNLQDALVTALNNPTASPPLTEIVQPTGDVAIVVSDRTRPCSYPAILPMLLNYLNASGVPDGRIFLLVAYGAHRRHTEDENRIFYGEEVLRRVRLFHHDSRAGSRLVHVGRTSRGTEVQLNRRYLDAAVSVVVGSVSFHYFAGFGGGRKAVFPGLASEEGILSNHRIFVEACEDSPSKMRAFKGELDDNPLNADLMEAVAMAPPSFALGFCLDRVGNVSQIFAGDWRESHRQACQFLLKRRLPCRHKYDLVIASCEGHPKDINFIQAHKTIDNAFDFVKPGGTLLILASCEDGVGSSTFLQWFEHEDAEAMRNALLKDYSMNGGTALALKMKADACRIFLYSSLEASLVRKMGLCPVQDVQADLHEIIKEKDVSSVAVLPEGGATVAERE